MSEAVKHKYELGSVVEVDVSVWSSSNGGIEVALAGTCRLAVVGHIRGAADEPLYILSDLVVEYPQNTLAFSPAKTEYKYYATVVEFGYAEEDLRPTGVVLPLLENVGLWLRMR